MLNYRYKAADGAGQSVKGEIAAPSESAAFAELRRRGLSPLDLKPVILKTAKASADKIKLNDAGLEDLFANLAVLLASGADIRTALSVLDDGRGPLRQVAAAISGGTSVEAAMLALLPRRLAHLGALITAGEARGDLPGGFEQAGRLLASRRKIVGQLWDALSYPVFVLVTAIAAMLVILLVVIPALAPLIDESGGHAPLYFKALVWLSHALQVGWAYGIAAVGLIGAGVMLAYRYGKLRAQVEILLLDGPLSSIVRALVFGGFARNLGDLLVSGAILTDALRLSLRATASPLARQRLEPVQNAIRQGRTVSEAMQKVKGLPAAIVRLTEVGEASGKLGQMLSRAGEREEAAALAQIDKLSKLLGPALIVGLGALVGGLMAGVLSALTDIGQVAGGG